MFNISVMVYYIFSVLDEKKLMILIICRCHKFNIFFIDVTSIFFFSFIQLAMFSKVLLLKDSLLLRMASIMFI